MSLTVFPIEHIYTLKLHSYQNKFIFTKKNKLTLSVYKIYILKRHLLNSQVFLIFLKKLIFIFITKTITIIIERFMNK